MKRKLPFSNETPSPPQSPERRRFLSTLAALSVLPAGLSFARVDNASKGVSRRLILIELAGGNDGLNTVIPFSQKRYYEARPVLGIPREQTVVLNAQLGLHPQLAPLNDAWRNNDLHIALGVGYPDPNRSHFRSSDIWHTASGSDKVLKRGWLADSFPSAQSAAFSAEGIAFGTGYGPFLGSSQSLVLDNPVVFAKQAKLMRPASAPPGNPALTHVVNVRQQIARGLKDLSAVIDARKGKQIKGSSLHKQLVVASEMIALGARVPMYKATLTGFDTHFYQPNRHNKLMEELGTELATLRERLMASGDWENTLVMTYSEFGRRAAENGSRGTDHGTAAPVILMGGRVKGGFSGQQPVFPAHDDEDLAFHLDYRRLYRTVAQQWLGASDAAAALRGFEPIDLIR
ncbi:MAG: DUF1501 domain-containing protein [Pseudomonadota bacterium]